MTADTHTTLALDADIAVLLVELVICCDLNGTILYANPAAQRAIIPEIAQTLVSLGVELRGLITLSNLQHAVAFVLQRLGGVSVCPPHRSTTAT